MTTAKLYLPPAHTAAPPPRGLASCPLTYTSLKTKPSPPSWSVTHAVSHQNPTKKPTPRPLHCRDAFIHEQNLADLGRAWGKSAGVVTITFKAYVDNGDREAILNRILTRTLHNKTSRRYTGVVTVREVHRSGESDGLLHYHLLVHGYGVDFKHDEVARRSEIRFWQRLVKTTPGLGYYTKFEPLLSPTG
jgi:hypothetical protein